MNSSSNGEMKNALAGIETHPGRIAGLPDWHLVHGETKNALAGMQINFRDLASQTVARVGSLANPRPNVENVQKVSTNAFGATNPAERGASSHRISAAPHSLTIATKDASR